MRLKKILSILTIAIFCMMVAASSAYAAQNLSAATVAEMAGFYTAGSPYYDNLADGDVCMIFKADSTREFVTYIYDDDSAQTEDTDYTYVAPDYISPGVAYSGNARWVKMDYDARYNSRQNLLRNTQWRAISTADPARGIGTLNYDNLAVATFTVGEVVTGGTSGATGVVQQDANSNLLYLGRCAGRFQDNEEISGGTSGTTADVNMPDSAAGVDELQNGDFTTDTDPPPGWNAGNASTLTTEAGGKVGNCMMITCDGTNYPYAEQQFSVTAGKTYYMTFYAKQGTQTQYIYSIYDVTNAATIYASAVLTEGAADWSTVQTQYFTAPTGCATVRLRINNYALSGSAQTFYVDEVSVYEVAPGCTSADNLAFDLWYKDTTLDVYQEFNGSNTQNGSFYAAKLVPTAASDFFMYPSSAQSTEAYWYKQYAGEIVTFALWCNTSVANHARLVIYDGVTTTKSSYHSGGGTGEWLEITKTNSVSATAFRVYIELENASLGTAYISQPMLTFGSSIGTGNYVPEADRTICLEKEISSQAFNAKTGATGFSDTTTTTLILTSDTGGLIGKGCEVVYAVMNANDVASGATNVYFQASQSIANKPAEFYCSPYTLTNDTRRYTQGWISCTSTGDYQYKIEASGTSTFDINFYKYQAIKWR